MIGVSQHPGLSMSPPASCFNDVVRHRSARTPLSAVLSMPLRRLGHRAILHPGLTHRTPGRQGPTIHSPFRD
jgi:hypothetical protein